MNRERKGTILIVDDEATNLDVLFQHLRQADFRVLVAEDGTSALERAERAQPDIILLDVQLPDFDGFEVRRRLSEREQTAEIPVIFLTVMDDVAAVVKGLDLSAVDYVTKPFAPEEVIARVDKHLAFHNLQKQLQARNAQLQRVNEDLTREIAQRQRLEAALREQTHELGERVKELDCLYGISRLVEKPGMSLDKILQGAVDLIPAAWQFPEITSARIILDEQEFSTPNFQETAWQQVRDIRARGSLAGRLQVCYLEEKPEIGEGPFLEEEGALLSAISERLGRTIERVQAEEALRESEERFRLLVEHTHDVVYATDPDGIVTYVSPYFAHYGYAPEELLSRNFLDFVAPEQRQRVMASFETGVRAGTNYPTVFQWLRRDGSRVWVEVVGNTVFDNSGQPIQQVGVMRDITERKRQEERTQSLLVLLETIDAGCFIKEPDGIYRYINREFERRFGVKREDVIGRDDAFVFGEEIAALLRENDLRIMASGKTKAVEEAGDVRGRGHVVYVTIKTPIIDEDGKVTGLCGVGIDITRQKRIENELRESEEKYRDLVERINDVIYTIDTSGELTYISPAVEPFLGYSPAEMVGRPFSDFISPEDLQRTGESFQQLAAGVVPGRNQYRVVTKAGEVRWMRASSKPIVEGEQVSGVRGVMTDVTDRVHAESQKEAALAALRESEARWRSLTETSPDHILVLDADLKIQFANFASPGLTVEELIGTPLYLYVAEERQAEVKEILEGVLETGHGDSYETTYHAPDGTDIHYESSVTPRRMPGSEEIVGLTLSSRDITLHKWVEEALRASQTLLQSALDALSANIAILDSSGTIIAVNASWRAFADENGLGWADYGVGRDYLATVDAASGDWAEGAEEAARGLRQLLSGQSDQFSLEYPCHSPGDERWFVVRATRFLSGEGIRVATSHEDITQQKQAEKQREEAVAAAERERLARDLHDAVTQTLFSMAAIAEVLPDMWERDPAKARRGLQDLQEQTQGALAEMRGLLLAWRPEAFQDSDLGKLIHELGDAMTARTRMPVTTTVVGECRPPAEVKLALYRIAQEALNNVVKHAGAGRAIVRLQCTAERTALSIRDDGRGFDQDDVSAQGLGLDIMRERAAAAGAALTIASEPGQGTEVTVAWEAASQQADEGRARGDPPDGERQ